MSALKFDSDWDYQDWAYGRTPELTSAQQSLMDKEIAKIKQEMAVDHDLVGQFEERDYNKFGAHLDTLRQFAKPQRSDREMRIALEVFLDAVSGIEHDVAARIAEARLSRIFNPSED